MKKWILLLLALVLVINLAAMGIGCKAKAPETPVVKEEPKPAEAKPAEAPPPPAPAPPAPAPPAPAAPPQKEVGVSGSVVMFEGIIFVTEGVGAFSLRGSGRQQKLINVSIEE